MPRQLPASWFKEDAVTLAPKLLGKIVRHGQCTGRIVEAEAYTDDAASHGRTLTKRSRLMHETSGHWYVYFTYGMHWCANITCGSGAGAVLIRAVEPLEGLELMYKRRKTYDDRNLCSGPAKFCQAFGIDGAENGLPIGGEFMLHDAPEVAREAISAGPRIGIRNARELPWRFYIKDNPFVGKKLLEKSS